MAAEVDGGEIRPPFTSQSGLRSTISLVACPLSLKHPIPEKWEGYTPSRLVDLFHHKFVTANVTFFFSFYSFV